MSAHDESSSNAAELAKVAEACERAAQAIRSSRTVRETMEAAVVDVPHHLKVVASLEVPTFGRLVRMRDARVEEVVKEQLASLTAQQSEFAASRDFDRLKAVDWYALRANYPDLYSKSLKEANLIIERKRNRKR